MLLEVKCGSFHKVLANGLEYINGFLFDFTAHLDTEKKSSECSMFNIFEHQFHLRNMSLKYDLSGWSDSLLSKYSQCPKSKLVMLSNDQL